MKTARKNHKVVPSSLTDDASATKKEYPRKHQQIKNEYLADWDYRRTGQSPLIAGWRQYIRERRARPFQ